MSYFQKKADYQMFEIIFESHLTWYSLLNPLGCFFVFSMYDARSLTGIGSGLKGLL